MRIADLLYSLASPDVVLVDLTPESSELLLPSIAAQIGVSYQRGVAGAALPSAALVAQILPGELESENVAATHVVFVDHVEAILEHGLLDRASRGGWELASTHVTEHPTLRYALVLRRPEREVARDRLRLINEYRYGKLFQLLQAATIAHLTAERDRASEQRHELAAQLARVTDELDQVRAGQLQASRALDQARTEAAQQRERAAHLDVRISKTHKRLESARKSLSFRIGRATRVAVTSSRKNPLAIPRRWLETFRGPDEILAELAPPPPRTVMQPRGPSPDELAQTERSVILLGLPADPRPMPGIAGIAGPRLTGELTCAARYRALDPHSWKYLLELEPPAYVLVTACGLAAGTAWGDWGTPGGRGVTAVLGELVDWCRSRHLPIVYWDTIGAPTWLALPPHVHFDAMFTVSPRRCVSARGDRPARLLLRPAIEPRVWNPTGVAPVRPSHPIYVGAYDRRVDRGELAALDAALHAAAGRGLDILDRHHGDRGGLSTAVRFPADLESRTRRPPPGAAVAAEIQRAGILLCGNPVGHADFPSWDLLRGLALGVHVLATPSELGEPVLAGGIGVASDVAAASEALDRLAARPLLDATWRASFERILTGYSLGDRLDEIARHCGVAAVAGRPPSLAVMARLRSAADLDALRDFLAQQTAMPDELRLLCDDGLDAEATLGPVLRICRLVVLRSGDPGALADTPASHLMCWTPAGPAVGDAIAELSLLARMSDAEVVALRPPSPTGGAAAEPSPVFHHGPLTAGCLIAIRREVAARSLRGGADPAALLDALTGEGRAAFIKAAPAAGRAGTTQRSVA